MVPDLLKSWHGLLLHILSWHVGCLLRFNEMLLILTSDFRLLRFGHRISLMVPNVSLSSEVRDSQEERFDLESNSTNDAENSQMKFNIVQCFISLGDSITFNHWVVSFWITCPSTWPVGGLKVWAIGTGVVSCRWVHWNKLRCLYSMWWPWMRHLSKALVYPSPYIRTGLQRLMNIDEL